MDKKSILKRDCDFFPKKIAKFLGSGEFLDKKRAGFGAGSFSESPS
jgi:hypothetical protein